MYCSNLYCSQLAPCPVHGSESQDTNHPTFYEKVKNAVKSVFPDPNAENTVVVQGETLPEVKTHSLEESVLYRPTAGDGGECSRTVKTECDTAHTWDQQHEGGLGHRAKETVREAAQVVGEKAVAGFEFIKEKAAGAQESLAETGHNAREKIEVEGEKVRLECIDGTARGAEQLQVKLGDAALSLREKERTEQQKIDGHSSPEGRIEHALDKVAQVAHMAKKEAIRETAVVAECGQTQCGNIASSLREQQRLEREEQNSSSLREQQRIEREEQNSS